MTSAGARLRVTFTEGSSTERMEIEFPLGHPRRRAEAHLLLRTKLRENLGAAYGEERAAELAAELLDDPGLPDLAVDALMGRLAA
jgi:2-methylcitrate dehydratase